MLSLQDGVKQIYSDTPKSVYFFTGPEYGVKKQYINVLASRYSGQIEEYKTFSDIISTFSKKSLIPRSKSVFVIRYDKEFSAKPDKQILNLNIPGVLIGIYEDESDETKLDKIFPDNTLRINLLSEGVACKHLCEEFPSLPELLIKSIVSISENFYSAQLVCTSVSNLPKESIHSLSRKDLEHLFGYEIKHDTQKFKLSIASRNFKLALQEIDAFDRDKGLLIYDILSTFLDIIKAFEQPYYDSYVKQYLKKWDFGSVKSMYDITYDQLELLRNNSKYSPETALTYICSLLQYQLR